MPWLRNWASPLARWAMHAQKLGGYRKSQFYVCTDMCGSYVWLAWTTFESGTFVVVDDLDITNVYLVELASQYFPMYPFYKILFYTMHRHALNHIIFLTYYTNGLKRSPITKLNGLYFLFSSDCVIFEDWEGVRNLVSALPPTLKRFILVSSIGVTKYNELPWRYISHLIGKLNLQFEVIVLFQFEVKPCPNHVGVTYMSYVFPFYSILGQILG